MTNSTSYSFLWVRGTEDAYTVALAADRLVQQVTDAELDTRAVFIALPTVAWDPDEAIYSERTAFFRVGDVVVVTPFTRESRAAIERARDTAE